MNNSVFISYHHDAEDERYKRLLVAWSANDNGHFNIKFQDESIGVSINSIDAAYIKRKIREKIENSDKFICLVGENTAKSDWVDWEIRTAKSLMKRIVAVKISRSYDSPAALYSIGAHWANSFNYPAIKKVLDDIYF